MWKLVERSVVFAGREGQLPVLSYRALSSFGIVDNAWGDPAAVATPVVSQHKFGNNLTVTLTSEKALFVQGVVDANRESPPLCYAPAKAYLKAIDNVNTLIGCGVNPKFFAATKDPTARIATAFLKADANGELGFARENVTVIQTLVVDEMAVRISFEPGMVIDPKNDSKTSGIIASFNFHLSLAAPADVVNLCHKHVDGGLEREGHAIKWLSGMPISRE